MLAAQRKDDVQVPPLPSSMAENGGVIIGGNGGAQLAENGNAVVPPHPPVDQTPAKKLRRTTAKPAAYGYISSASDDDDVEDEDSEDELEEEESEEEQAQEEEEEIEGGDGEEAEEAEEEEEEEDEDEESIDKPKLAEGFYIIEAIRARRTRRGKREYRIKWRGWPESENTWEPMVNLKNVPHVIAAYEESLRAKRSRKRKRKNTYSFTQTKKRTQRRSSASAVKDTVSAAAPPLEIAEETIPAAVTAATAAETADNVVLDSGVVDDTEMPDIEVGDENLNENGVDLVAPEENEGAGIGVTNDDVGQGQVEPQEAQVTAENTVANGSVRTESVEEAVLLEAGRTSTGARRRKSGPVRRFKFDTNNSAGDVADNVENQGLNNAVFTGLNVGDQLPANLDSTTRDVRDNRDVPNRDVRANIYDIIEIVKPIKFSTYEANNSVEVSLNFVVRKSDGQVMTVDNRYLKAHYPVLLVNYYEQRIRY